MIEDNCASGSIGVHFERVSALGFCKCKWEQSALAVANMGCTLVMYTWVIAVHILHNHCSALRPCKCTWLVEVHFAHGT